MSVNVTEYFNQMQQEGLSALKQSQDATISAFEKFRSMSRQMSENPGSLPTFENLPTPAQYVEMSFGFAAQVLELRKAYALKFAEMIADGQKQAEAGMKQAAGNVAQAATSVSNGTMPQKPMVPTK